MTKGMSQIDQTEPTISDICTACGMCCDGTLFSYVEITQEEENLLADNGFEVSINKDKEHQFEQPCPKLISGCCSFYQSRPQSCRAYSCYLIQEVSDGDISAHQALDTVADLQAQIQWFFDHLDDVFRDPTPVTTAPAAEIHYNWLENGDYPTNVRDVIYDRLTTLQAALDDRALTPTEAEFLDKVNTFLTTISEHIHPHDLMEDLTDTLKKLEKLKKQKPEKTKN